MSHRALALVAVAFAAACATDESTQPASTSTATTVARGARTDGTRLRARVPLTQGPLAPSGVTHAGPRGGETPAAVDGRWMSDSGECDGCHADVVAMWKTSAHAFASFNNPIYRVSVERFRAEVGHRASRHCAGCHDPALLIDGAMDGEIEPADPRTQVGVTCKTCHSIQSARVDGNGSYVLANDPIPLPVAGDAASVARHKERARPLREGIELCASCHRAFLDASTGNAAFLAGTDDVTPWRQSAYAGSTLARLDEPIPRDDCRGCHMRREKARYGDVSAKGGTIASHRFLGGHTWLAAMRGDDEQLAALSAQLEASATIDVAAVVMDGPPADGARALPADGAAIERGTAVRFDVVVKNVGVGHRFPGGTLDAQDTWIEVTVEDRDGQVLAASGVDDAVDAHRLRALVVDDAGQPRLERDVSHFRAVAHNHTLLPRDAEVVQYGFEVPADLPPSALPLRVAAKLRHRSRDLALQAAACADSKAPRGRAFRGRTPLDPCAPQPVVLVASAEAWVGEGAGARPRSPRPAWERLLDHGRGMMRAVQERAEEARPSFDRALVLLGPVGAPHDRARVLAAIGELEAREGRAAEALARFAEAAALAPGEPAIEALRGAAFAAVWRWPDSIAPLTAAAERAPLDDGGAARLAVGLASRGGDDRAALEAAWSALAMTPRDPDVLRVQALMLAQLDAPQAEVDAARAAYEAYRVPDDVPKIKTACSKTVPSCARERLPVHAHELSAPSRGPAAPRSRELE